jgi:hypothetical protein
MTTATKSPATLRTDGKRGRPLAKTAHDKPGPQRTRCIVLLWRGGYAGKIIMDYGGSTCTASYFIHAGPIGDLDQGRNGTGQAGGYGYDKASAALCDAFDRNGLSLDGLGHGTGLGAARAAFEALGYTWIEAL